MSGRLRFCMFSTYYPPYSYGGDGITLRRLCRALVRAGHDVTVVHDADAFTALGHAKLDVSSLGYLNAHATSTPVGDPIELAAVKKLVGSDTGRLPMSSTKSATGHLLGAAGAIEAIFSVLAIRDNVAPPTLDLDARSVNTAIDVVPHTAKKREINTVLSNSFGFGGTNASLILRRVV